MSPGCCASDAGNVKSPSHVSLDVDDVVLDLCDVEASADMTTSIEVSGICCPSEVPIIEKCLMKLPGVQSVSVNVTAKSATVHHNGLITSSEALVAALNKASLGASLKRGDKAEEEKLGSRPSALLIACGFLWIISMGSLINAATFEWMAYLKYLKYVALAAVVMGVPRIARKAFGALRNGILDINCLMVIATCGAVAIGDYSEGAAVVFLFGLSEWLEDMATAKARNALASLLAMKPEVAVRAGTNERVPVEHVRVGDRLAVKAGEKVPVDGTVVSGASSVDEAALTGESAPVQKKVGSKTSGGTINVGGGYMEIEATTLSSDSAVARIVKLIEEAHSGRSKTEKRVETFAKIYTPVIVFIAAAFAAVPWLFVALDWYLPTGEKMTEEQAMECVYTSLVLLVVSCPCALVISTPVTYVSTLSTAATHNVLIRGGEHLESLGNITAIGMDKTGTLTEGRFAVRSVLGPFNGRGAPDMPRILSLMAAVEQQSTHPVAAALVAHAREGGGSLDLVPTDMVDRAGEGVEAVVKGSRVQVGSRRLASRMGWVGSDGTNVEGACLPFRYLFSNRTAAASSQKDGAYGDFEQRIVEMESLGQTVCYLGVDGKLAAVFGVADAPRAEAKEAVAMMRAYGVEVVMLTGDRRLTAEAVARQLGVTNIKAELLPEDKVTAITTLKAECESRKRRFPCLPATGGGVGMVGDGINDAAALAASTIGIAMGAAGTQVAMENAHVILMDSDLMKLVLSVKLGRYAVRKIKQNISFAVVSKVVMVGLTFGGYASLWGAILADLGAMLLVTLNSSMVLGQRKQKQEGHAHGNDGGGCYPPGAEHDKMQTGPGDGPNADHAHAHGGSHGHGHGH